MILAAIDIGSNATRLYITRVVSNGNKVRFKKVHYMRYPLRLGKDVFKNGEITKYKYREFREWIRLVNDTMSLFKVDHYYACATSAMRDAINGQEIADRIFEKDGLQIDIIDGQKEAKLIASVIESVLPEKENVIHVDVGGGSTEINIYLGGKKAHFESFQVGTVRYMDIPESRKEFERMNKWIANKVNDNNIAFSIGTGGNIRKLQKISYYGTNEPIHIDDLKKTKEKLENHTLHERIETLMLNPDRAEVIIPAANIYISVMAWSGVEEIRVPDVGLKDGILLDLYHQVMFKK